MSGELKKYHNNNNNCLKVPCTQLISWQECFFNIKSNTLTETKHNHKVLPKDAQTPKKWLTIISKDTNEEGIKEEKHWIIVWSSWSIESVSHCSLQSFFPIYQHIFPHIPFMFWSAPDQKAPFSTHWPKDKQVSLIWSSCSRTVSTSHSLLVTANITAAVLFETPPLVFYKTKMNENSSLRSVSLDSSATGWDDPVTENGGETFGLICYCMEHTTLTL